MKKILKKNIIVLFSLLLMTTTMTNNLFNFTTISANNTLNTDNLKMDKSVIDQGNGEYTINLNAYATGNVSVITKSKPTDVILVLDTSYSMQEGVDVTYKYEPIVTKEINGPYDMFYYTNSADYYYISDGNGGYMPIFQTEDFQNTTIIRQMPDGSLYTQKNYRVYAYTDINGNMYAPDDGSGNRLATEFTNGTEEDQNRYKSYPITQIYRENVPVYAPGTPKKIDALKSSVKSFIESAVKDGGDHRFAIVSFSDNAKIETNYLDVKTDADNLASIVSNLQLGNATDVGAGMEKAMDIVKSDTMISDTSRSRAVIMFTDGKPDSSKYYGAGGQYIGPANKAISYSNEIKKKGYTVFSAGVSNLLNNTLDPSLLTERSDVGLMNKYMQYLSSNYPNATSITNEGEGGNYQGGKFLFANDSESFKKMFETIRDEITSSTSTLDAETELRDYISDYFTLDESADIKVYTQSYLGGDQWGDQEELADAKVSVGKDKKSISVKGFSYKDNFVVKERAGGKRLTVQLKVKVKDGFIGGNKINTNMKESAIYYDDTLVKEFNQPTVNMLINYDGKDTSSSIYITQSIKDLNDLIDADMNTMGIQYLQKKNNVLNTYTLDGVNNAFVNIKISIKTTKGVLIGEGMIGANSKDMEWTLKPDLSKLTESETLNITTSVIPTMNATTGEQIVARTVNVNTQATINVFKPTLNIKNEYAFAGEVYDVTDVINQVSWGCKENTSAQVPKGDVPTIRYEFENKDGIIRDATAYEIVKTDQFLLHTYLGDKNITTYTTLQNTKKPERADFEIQAIFGELNITKTIDAAYTKQEVIKSNQTFLFQITRKDPVTNEIKDTYYQSIDFDQNDIHNGMTTKTIKVMGLKKGIYEVKEVQDWSWKYLQTGSITNYKKSSDTLYIGEKQNSGLYFGAASGSTFNGQEISNPGTIKITNKLNTSLNVIGDCANAINKFVR